MKTADDFSRLSLLFLSRENTVTAEDVEKTIYGLKLSIFVDAISMNCRNAQICLLSAVNVASRWNFGGQNVQVLGLPDEVRLLANFPGAKDLRHAIELLAGSCERVFDPAKYPAIVIGDAPPTHDAPDFFVRPIYSGWFGGVVPSGKKPPNFSTQIDTIALAPILAAGLAAAQCFKFLNNEGSAVKHEIIGLDLWDTILKKITSPTPFESQKIKIPSKLWFGGLGHLGQAYLWSLSQLVNTRQNRVTVTLQDTDKVTLSTLSTSILCFSHNVGEAKISVCADWMKKSGFRVCEKATTLTNDSHIDTENVAFIGGFDNMLARRTALRHFDKVIDCGLGHTRHDFRSMAVHTFPRPDGSMDTPDVWRNSVTQSDNKIPVSIQNLEREGMLDKCGAIALSGKSVGTPFVGLIASTVVLAELFKISNGETSHGEPINIDIRTMPRI